MLVLGRKKDQKIILQIDGIEDIEILLIDSFKNKARIGITAPKEVKISREELIGQAGDPEDNKKSVQDYNNIMNSLIGE